MEQPIAEQAASSGPGAFQQALSETVYDGSAWLRALEALAADTGGSIASYIAWSGPSTPFLSLHWGLDPAELEAFVAAGGGDPQQNPLLAAALRMSAGRIYTSDEAWPPEARRASPLWNRFMAGRGLAHVSAVVLERSGQDLFLLSLTRSEAEGPLGAAQARRFAWAADRWLEAMQAARAVGAQSARLAATVLETAPQTALVFDSMRRVVSMTAEAERLLRGRGPLRVAQDRLSATTPGTSEALNLALCRAVGLAGCPQPAEVRVAAEDGDLMVRFTPLPQPGGVGLEPSALAIVEEAPPAFTGAEAAVARALGRGLRAADIAVHRGVAVDTVRTQIKSLYRKTGASCQHELVALLRGRL